MCTKDYVDACREAHACVRQEFLGAMVRSVDDAGRSRNAAKRSGDVAETQGCCSVTIKMNVWKID